MKKVICLALSILMVFFSVSGVWAEDAGWQSGINQGALYDYCDTWTKYFNNNILPYTIGYVSNDDKTDVVSLCGSYLFKQDSIGIDSLESIDELCITINLQTRDVGSKQESGFIIHGRELDQPISNATCKRMTGEAFEKLGMKGNYSSHDWPATQATALIENGMTSKAVADLLGHADGRMVETVYSPARQAGILKNKDLIEQMNKSYAG